MGLLLLLVFVVAPLAELYVIIQMAQVIGGWKTIALLVVVGALGAWILKRQGLSALARVSEAVNAGRVPTRELVDGFLLMFAGALMLAPGFLTDVIAYVLILPPSRAVVRSALMRRFREGRHGALFTVAGPGFGGRFVGTFRAGDVVDATGRDPHDAGRPQLDR